MKYILFLFFSIITYSQNYKFVPVDEGTLEFISEVKYTLHYNKKEVYSSFTSKDSITRLPNNINFDSISFSKFNFKETGLKKEALKEIVLLSKTIFELDEVVVVGSKQKEFIIGEKSRFINRSSNSLAENADYGLLFREFELKNKLISSLTFFIEKVKHKTTYKIKFYAAEEKGNPLTSLTLHLSDVLFESPVLTLEVGTKNKVEIDLEEYNLSIMDKNIFVSIELQAYYDENNIQIQPEFKSRTKLKFQLSKKLDFYSKMSDLYTKDLTKEPVNVNAMINHDFASEILEKPHKSNFVAPAILLKTTVQN